MALPWFKAPTNLIVSGMARDRWTADNPCPRAVAVVQMLALRAHGTDKDWSIRDLAERWCWTRSRVHRLLRGTYLGQERDNSETVAGQSPEQSQGDSPGQRDNSETGAGQERDASRAGDLLEDEDRELEEQADSESVESPEQDSPQKPKPPSPAIQRREKTIQRVYEAWKGYPQHSRVRRETPREADAKYLRGRLGEDDEQTLLLVCRWIHEAPDAKFWRDNKRTGIATIFKADKWSERIEAAETWKAAGYPDSAPEAGANGQRGPDPRIAAHWTTFVQDVSQKSHIGPPGTPGLYGQTWEFTVDDLPTREAMLRATMDTFGTWEEVKMLKTADLPYKRPKWCKSLAYHLRQQAGA